MHASTAITAFVAPVEHAARVRPRLPEGIATFRSAAELLNASDVPAGLVLVGPGVPLADAVGTSRELRVRGGHWGVIHLDWAEDGSVSALPLSVGYLQSLEDVLNATRPDSVAPVLELGVVLRHVARARHDINNPLTSALAETQLLLMDVEEGELRESLETIQRQIRRIRDLVANLSVLRPPVPSSRQPPASDSPR
jgi:signal transduction histidine kinase